MTPLDDLDPPTFRFGLRRKREDPDAAEGAAGEQAPEGERGEGEDPDIPRFEQPEEQAPEITVTKPGEEEPKPPLWRRLPFARS